MAEYQDQTIAVLTGDIVASSAIEGDGLAHLLGDLSAGAAKFEAETGAGLIGAMHVFRGDSWQLALSGWPWALRLAAYLRAVSIGSGIADTRVAVAIGAAETVVEKAVSQSSGPVFVASGKALDTIGAARLAYDDLTGNHAGRAGAAVCTLLDVVISDWTAKQADAAAQVLLQPDLTDAAIVEQMGETSDAARRNFSQLRNRSHVNAIDIALRHLEPERQAHDAVSV